MRLAICGLVVGVLAASQCNAGITEDNFIFGSSFEGDEGCIVLDGLSQAVIIPTISLTGDLTLNGGSFPANDFDDAVFSLRDRQTGAMFPIGNSHDGNYSVQVVPGLYDLMYDLQSTDENPEVPQNRGAVLMEGLTLFESQVLDVNVTAYLIGGDFLLNNAAFPASEYDDADLYLVSQAHGEIFLGNSHDQFYNAVPVLPGTYEIRYEKESKQEQVVPSNTWGHVGNVNITGNDPSLHINVEVVNLDVSFLHNGAPFPLDEYDDGTFWLESSSGDRAYIGNSHDSGPDAQVIPGVYDIFWELETLGNSVPFNRRARVASKVAVNGPNLEINVLSWPLDGDFLMNGSPFPVQEQQTGRILLIDSVAGVDDNELGKTFTSSYDRRVVQGTYAVAYQHLDGDQVPQNKFHTLASGLVVSKARSVDFDVPARLFDASAHHNGALFPNNESQAGYILLRDTVNNDLVILGKTSEQNFSEWVIPGTYDVFYSHIAGNDVPANFMARILEGLVVEPATPGPVLLGGGSTEFHVTSYVYPGGFYRNDAVTPADAGDDGQVVLLRNYDSVNLGTTSAQTFSRRIIFDPAQSLFQVHYRAEDLGALMPANSDSRVQCATVVAPPF